MNPSAVACQLCGAELPGSKQHSPAWVWGRQKRGYGSATPAGSGATSWAWNSWHPQKPPITHATEFPWHFWGDLVSAASLSKWLPSQIAAQDGRHTRGTRKTGWCRRCWLGSAQAVGLRPRPRVPQRGRGQATPHLEPQLMYEMGMTGLPLAPVSCSLPECGTLWKLSSCL